jgi:hypothetical protein
MRRHPFCAGFKNVFWLDKSKRLTKLVNHLIGVEVTAAATVKDRDLRGLRKLSSQAGGQFKMGVLLYDGDETMPLGDGIWAAPLSSLWV